MTLDGMTSDIWDKLTPGERERLRDNSGLTRELLGLEGWRVEVRDTPEAKPRRFIVGRSTGWRPIHIEVLTRRSLGGCACNASYASVRKIERVR